MIINYPTGLYNSFGDLDDSPNITWYISNNEPPRSKDVIIKIPVAEEIRKIPSPTIDRLDRRYSFGELIYSINQSNDKISMSGKKEYSEGDILEFSDDNREDILIPEGKKIEARHDLNEIDMKSIGLEDDDIDRFNVDITNKKSELETTYLTLRTEIGNIEINIKESQKKINESNKALNAIRIVGDNELEKKIQDKLNEYNNDVSKYKEEHTEKSKQLSDIVTELQKIDMVAK